MGPSSGRRFFGLIPASRTAMSTATDSWVVPGDACGSLLLGLANERIGMPVFDRYGGQPR